MLLHLKKIYFCPPPIFLLTDILYTTAVVLGVDCESRPNQVILRSFKKFRRQEVDPGGSIRGKDGTEVVLVWSLCDSSVKSHPNGFRCGL